MRRSFALLWLDEPIRPTKDVDLLGFGDTSAEALKRVFVALCAIESPDDGLTFLPDGVHVDAIREDQDAGDRAVVLNNRCLHAGSIAPASALGGGDAVALFVELIEILKE